MAMSLEQKYLCSIVKEEVRIIKEKRPTALLPRTSWEQVLMAADLVAAEANTVGRVWTAENLSDMRSLVENIKRFSGLVQKLIDVMKRTERRACTDDRRKCVTKLVKYCVGLLKGAVLCYDIKEDRKGAKIPKLVNPVWKRLKKLKNPKLRDFEKFQPQVQPDIAGSPHEFDQNKSGRRVTFREFIKGQETDQDSDFTDDDATRFVASVEKASRLNEAIEMLVQEFVRADIDTYGREDAFRQIVLAMGEMTETLNQVVGGQEFAEELCQDWTSSTHLMKWIVTEFRSSTMHRSCPF